MFNRLLEQKDEDWFSFRRDTFNKPPAATRNEPKLETKDLCCFVCLKQFDGEEHIPRKLTCCEHTFCQKCLQEALTLAPKCIEFGSSQHILLTPKGDIKCPIDGVMQQAPEITSVFDLTINQKVVDQLKLEVKVKPPVVEPVSAQQIQDTNEDLTQEEKEQLSLGSKKFSDLFAQKQQSIKKKTKFTSKSKGPAQRAVSHSFQQSSSNRPFAFNRESDLKVNDPSSHLLNLGNMPTNLRNKSPAFRERAKVKNYKNIRFLKQQEKQTKQSMDFTNYFSAKSANNSPQRVNLVNFSGSAQITDREDTS